jgi:hypothetical protein
VIPVLRRVTGTISNLFTKYLNNVPRKYEIGELQKTSVLGTAHILSESNNKKYKTCNGGKRITCTVKFNWRIAAILCP